MNAIQDRDTAGWLGGWEGWLGGCARRFFIFCLPCQRHNVRLLLWVCGLWVASGDFPGRSDGARGGLRWVGGGWKGV